MAMRIALMWTVCSALILSLSSLADAADTAANRGRLLVTTKSRLQSAMLVSADASDWTFKPVDGEERTIAASEVVRWGSFVPAVGGHRVRLSSGGELLALVVEIRDGEILLESALLKEVRLRPGSVSAVTFDMPADQTGAQTLEK